MRSRVGMAVVVLAGAAWAQGIYRVEIPPEAAKAEEVKVDDAKAGAVMQEARIRAQLLHEMIHGSLQVMHRDFFDPSERDRIPSSSLEDVFVEMKRGWDVEIRWLAVNGKAMNIDHHARNDFEKAAVESIGSGKEMYEAVADQRYLYAGAITLGNSCLKCHAPDRQSLENRKAAVVISMPLKVTAKENR